jgi:hypothetical protein
VPALRSVVAPCKRVLATVRETAMAMVEQAQRTRAAYSTLVSESAKPEVSKERAA